MPWHVEVAHLQHTTPTPSKNILPLKMVEVGEVFASLKIN